MRSHSPRQNACDAVTGVRVEATGGVSRLARRHLICSLSSFTLAAQTCSSPTRRWVQICCRCSASRMLSQRTLRLVIMAFARQEKSEPPRKSQAGLQWNSGCEDDWPGDAEGGGSGLDLFANNGLRHHLAVLGGWRCSREHRDIRPLARVTVPKWSAHAARLSTQLRELVCRHRF